MIWQIHGFSLSEKNILVEWTISAAGKLPVKVRIVSVPAVQSVTTICCSTNVATAHTFQKMSVTVSE